MTRRPRTLAFRRFFSLPVVACAAALALLLPFAAQAADISVLSAAAVQAPPTERMDST